MGELVAKESSVTINNVIARCRSRLCVVLLYGCLKLIRLKSLSLILDFNEYGCVRYTDDDERQEEKSFPKHGGHINKIETTTYIRKRVNDNHKYR